MNRIDETPGKMDGRDAQMGLSGRLSGKDQPEESNEPSAGRREADAAAATQVISSASSPAGKDFRGVFSATLNIPARRRGFLVTGAVLWAIGGAAALWACAQALSPLAGLYYLNWLDIAWFNVTDLNWSRVHWLHVLICAIVALIAYWLGSSPMRAWRKLRKLPEGLIGNGIRVLPDGAVEIGVIKVLPKDLLGTSATGRGLIQSVRWRKHSRHSKEREILVNILRTADRGLMVSHVLLKVAGGHEAMSLEFIQAGMAAQSTLWIARESEIIWLDRSTVDAQLAAVSSILTPIPRRDRGQLSLTFTELAAEAREFGGAGAAIGVTGGAGAGSISASATNSLQARANDLLARRVLPSAIFNLAGIVGKFGYILKPNLEAERFRGW